MTPKQMLTQARRLCLEKQMWDTQKDLCDLKRECEEHVIIRGQIVFSPAKEKVVNTHEGLPDDWNGGCYGASCAICGVEFGWWCPDNPKHYCEYDKSDPYGCKFCHQPDERK